MGKIKTHIHELETENIIINVTTTSLNKCVQYPIVHPILLVLKCLPTPSCVVKCAPFVPNRNDLTTEFRVIGEIISYKYSRKNCCYISKYIDLPEEISKEYLIYMARQYHPQYTLIF